MTTQEVWSNSDAAALKLSTPLQIEMRGLAVGRFGKHEVEVAAAKLLLFFRSRGEWTRFTIRELVEFYNSQGWDPDLMFFGLSGVWYDDASLKQANREEWTDAPPYLVLFTDGRYAITEKFIRACMEL
ncbi:MAG: hypothetical protein A2653_01390 [Candidatus Zambryskibacteria bacterium RIFCSPHIGHO2_01_FULL_43_25]|uniref:Uncharacterized protein n=1 Tax=Candidatus Zambryskibacteria bacterium RIFCSPLOWO2_01_FULL_45_21 TaxID=1802761 RepID=A0A1G2U3U1_9BACT|nr:MAG: hypothetical protein A2653_01390 [Candidatus Zambryskibacteria bacterium RIFCSPHIGHO2_01_FULL_43_25]OHB00391.1 MAG: hypothetical protein A3E94_01650 [Candidatus Zambryskibacteria bacterium RIFCSPHIGHO2_12_FULL_44_12b]OHB04186.1 MAG: hypothetical protein A3B14_02125 [Candidatus Zambryskibacteria bacterium RIFCSPLOWO2_01_FULL_45_21]